MRKLNLFLVGLAFFGAIVSNAQSNSSRGQINPDEVSILPKQNPTDKSAAILSQGFEDVTNLVAGGWFFQNNSNGMGSTTYFQGNSSVFNAYDGNPTDYLGMNFNSANSVLPRTISNWMLTPELQLENGCIVSFYTRAPISNYPDRLQVRLSTNGISTNVGSSETSVGDFTILLEDINPTYTVGGYPEAWTKYEITLSGLSGIQNCRVGFRYFVEEGGPSGSNSDYIGIDRVEILEAPQVPLSNWAFALIGVALLSFIVFKFRK